MFYDDFCIAYVSHKIEVRIQRKNCSGLLKDWWSISVYLISLVVTIPWNDTRVYRGYFQATCRLCLSNLPYMAFEF